MTPSRLFLGIVFAASIAASSAALALDGQAGPRGAEARQDIKETAQAPFGTEGQERTSLAILPSGEAWLQYAVASQAPDDKPWIAIVIDDLGLNQTNARRAIEMPPPLTLAFMTYAEGLPSLTRLARSRGHELLLHFPMEPIDLKHNYPGKNALMVSLPRAEIEKRLDWGLSRFEGFVGVNNHMGSRFTQDSKAMEPVVTALKKRGLMFLDSVTSGRSVAGKEAREAGLPVAVRDVFLDHEPNRGFVRKQLDLLESIARRQGYAVAIGHPHGFTLSILEEWIPQAKARGFAIVPLTAIVKRRGQIG